MNILIMDDDEYTVDAIKAMIDWEQIGIDNVFSATTVTCAKQIFEAAELDIMLCDIEMHCENGLDFVEWARKKGSMAEVFFLTSFAEFSYAQKALRLQSREYILKPVQYQVLNETLRQAVIHAKERKKEQRDKDKWRQSLKLRKESFWSKLMRQEITEPKEIEKYRQFLTLAYSQDDHFLFLVIEIYDFRTILEKVERGMYDFIVRNITEELLGKEGFHTEVMLRTESEDSARWNVILRVEDGVEACYRDVMLQNGKNYISLLRQKLDSIVGCYVGIPVSYTEIPQQTKLLFEMVVDDVFGANQVQFLENYSVRMVSCEQPEFTDWENLILEKEYIKVQQEIGQYLLKLEKEKNANTESLVQFLMEFHYMIMSVLKQRNITVSLVWDDIRTEENKEAVNSIHNMQKYTRKLLSKVFRSLDQVGKEKSVVHTVQKYISEHYAEELTRDDLAKLVYLNPDYLSRMFRAETGESLSNYLIRYRIEKAKELLSNTNSPINQVACDVGYTNFSYFAKIFRKYAQCTPNEYRKKMKNGTNQ